jgi:hypothetical protein
MVQGLQNILAPSLSKKDTGIGLTSEWREFKTKVLEIHYIIFI